MTFRVPKGVLTPHGFSAPGYGYGRAVSVSGGGGGGGGYTQNRVKAPGTAYFDYNGAGLNEGPSFEFSVWFNLDNLSGNRFFFGYGLDTRVGILDTGNIFVRVEDSFGNLMWVWTGPAGDVVAGTPYHLYLSFELETGTPTVLLDGVDVYTGRGTNSTGPLAQDNRFVQLNKTASAVANFGGSSIIDGELGDLWLDALDTPHGYDAFQSSGEPVDLSELPTPQIWLGGSMTASDWNSAVNNGTASLTFEGTGSFTDV